ncbi:hypothetical protein ACOME3_009212 [Neoechinorhynchus agilis]
MNFAFARYPCRRLFYGSWLHELRLDGGQKKAYLVGTNEIADFKAAHEKEIILKHPPMFSDCVIGVLYRRESSNLLNCSMLRERFETHKPYIVHDTAYENMAKLAALKASRIRWIGLSMMGFQFGFLFELIWQTYSWDIMEPITYFITFTSGTLAALCYSIQFKHDFEYSHAMSKYLNRRTQ